jgi:hypothetical protein
MARKTMAGFALLAAFAFAGCSQPGQSAKGSAANGGNKHDEKDAHAHGAGPHGGPIFDLGRFHGEFTVDHGKQEVTIYIYGNDEKTPKPVAAEKLDLTIKSPAFTVELKPQPLDREPAGKSSRFVGKHEKFGHKQEFEGTVVGVIEGKPSQGQFKEEEHKDGKPAGK